MRMKNGLHSEVINWAEKGMKRISIFRSHLPPEMDEKREPNNLKSSLLILEVIAKTFLKNFGSVANIIQVQTHFQQHFHFNLMTQYVQNARIIHFLIPKDLIKLAVFYSQTRPNEKWSGEYSFFGENS
jgi:hypothetical protein